MAIATKKTTTIKIEKGHNSTRTNINDCNKWQDEDVYNFFFFKDYSIISTCGLKTQKRMYVISRLVQVVWERKQRRRNHVLDLVSIVRFKWNMS